MKLKGFTVKRKERLLYQNNRSYVVSRTGIEPASAEPESAVLSIRRSGQIYPLYLYIVPHLKRKFKYFITFYSRLSGIIFLKLSYSGVPFEVGSLMGVISVIPLVP